ncbi:MAG: hypothetical protein ABSE48_10890 [Verrucomicrobiota bacterium]|jgi:hypothetical protein
MNPQTLSTTIKAAVLVSALSCGVNARAITAQSNQNQNTIAPGQSLFETVAFSDSAEAGMLHRAYRILATGDHDYHGHRVRAMHQVEAAAKLLGLDLSGDLKNRENQVLSDDKLREAGDLISRVLSSAEVKDQKRVTKHLAEAVNQINTALSVH